MKMSFESLVSVFLMGLVLCLSVSGFAQLNNQGDVVQDLVQVNCHGDDGALSFKLNRSTSVVTFTDVEAFKGAQIPLREPIAAQIGKNEMLISYNWYFNAQYSLAATKYIRSWQSGDEIKILLNGDDADGATFNDVSFECVVK